MDFTKQGNKVKTSSFSRFGKQDEVFKQLISSKGPCPAIKERRYYFYVSITIRGESIGKRFTMINDI